MPFAFYQAILVCSFALPVPCGPRTKVEATVIGRYWAGVEGSMNFGIRTVRAEWRCTGNRRHHSKSLEILASISVGIFRSILADKPSGLGVVLHSGRASRNSASAVASADRHPARQFLRYDIGRPMFAPGSMSAHKHYIK